MMLKKLCHRKHSFFRFVGTKPELAHDVMHTTKIAKPLKEWFYYGFNFNGFIQ